MGRTAVRWPAGVTARFVPDLGLVGPDGEVVAREGDAMVLGGEFVGADATGVFGACSIDGTTYPLR